MAQNKKKLIRIAHRVRQSFNKIAPSKNLDGLCCCVSKAILDKAKTANIKAVFVYGNFNGWSHCWVEYEGIIVDATATQFGVADEVLITDVNDARYSDKIKTSHPEKCAKNPISRAYMSPCKNCDFQRNQKSP